MQSQLNKIINKKNNLLNKIEISSKRKIHIDVNSDNVNNFFCHLEESYCKYSDLIRNSFSPDDISEIKFGKFFKNNGGIKPHINKIYEICSIKKCYPNSRNVRMHESFIIFDFIINDKLYYSIIFIDVDNGSCETCNMGYNKECKMYINTSIKNLIYYSIGNELDKYL